MSERFWSKVAKAGPDECWLWRSVVNNRGYGKFVVGSRTDGTSRMAYAHRHAYELVNGPIPFGLVVRHKCDVPACVNPAHLETGTQSQNMRDCFERGRARMPDSRGENHGNVKLTDMQVAEIRAKYNEGGRSQRSLASEYGVHQAQIHRVIRGKSRSLAL